MTAIVSVTTSVDDLNESDRSACFRLISEQFLGVRRDDFERDFAEKEAVLLLRDRSEDGPIVGFSTIVTLPFSVAGRRVRAIFSGDTVVDPRYRFSSGALKVLGSYFVHTLARFPGEAVYYVLISKGWRTYKMLSSLFRHFTPSPRESAESDRAIIDAFGVMKYPRSFDPDAGLIRAGDDAPRLRPDGVDAVATRVDERVAFFLRSNPRYLDGDELVCAGRVAPENFAAPLQRALAQSGGDRDDDRLAVVGALLGR